MEAHGGGVLQPGSDVDDAAADGLWASSRGPLYVRGGARRWPDHRSAVHAHKLERGNVNDGMIERLVVALSGLAAGRRHGC